METDGLLERRPDPADRRARRLYLTKKTKPLLDKIWRLAELTRAETFSGISREDRDAFMDVLERVYHNICVLDERSSVQPPNPVADMQEAPAADSSTRRSRKTLAK
jgi:MarR family transcriptional regulator for hemolysin